jgi:hypothetical protein
MTLLARIVFGLVGDVLFDAAASRARAYESEIDRFFERRGYRVPPAQRPTK